MKEALEKAKSVSYGLAGLNYYLEDKLKYANPADYVMFGAIHVWGINLESKHSKDYSKYIKNEVFEYFAYLDTMISTISKIMVAGIINTVTSGFSKFTNQTSNHHN